MKPKYCSLISYCTARFTKMLLDKFVSCGVIENYFFCEHQPEGKSTKFHIHVYCVGLRTRVQPQDIQKEFIEVVDGENRPRGANSNPREDSSLDDAILYCYHDEWYIKEHLKEEREFYYSPDDVVTSFDSDYWHRLVLEAKENIKRSDALGDIPDDVVIQTAYQLAGSGDWDGALMFICMKAPKFSKAYIQSLTLLMKLNGRLNTYMADALATYMRQNLVYTDINPFDRPDLIDAVKMEDSIKS